MDWKYYNHAIIPTAAPHEAPALEEIRDGSVWKKFQNRKPLFIRYTTDFDTFENDDWYYCIKDTPFDLAQLNSKKRYEINRGKKNFEVKEIDPVEYFEALLEVRRAAYTQYSEKVEVDPAVFSRYTAEWKEKNIVLAAFSRETDEMAGYVRLLDCGDWMKFEVQQAKPEFEKKSVNAALVAGILEYCAPRLGSGFYICDGERNVLHQTAFQDYLEKYFGFRKAPCRLHLIYHKKIKPIIKIAYPFRKILLKFDRSPMIHRLNGVLALEEVVRKQKRIK